MSNWVVQKKTVTLGTPTVSRFPPKNHHGSLYQKRLRTSYHLNRNTVPVQFGSQMKQNWNTVPNRFGTSDQFNRERRTTSFRYDCELRFGTPRTNTWIVAS
ncbi:hypothetical protein Hanom_Chr11g01033101 [Helianthus anomalus]